MAPLSWLYALYRAVGGNGGESLGDEETSVHFWGDMAKDSIRYVRNFTFNDIDTLRVDPRMPYAEARKPYVGYWFSSSDGHTVEEFADLIHPKNLGRLESERGLCIVYTHFASGFTDGRGVVQRRFAERLKDLSGRPGWFAPVGEILDWLVDHGPSERIIGYKELFRLNVLWLRDRVAKRLRYGR